jgi:hypothetical protein
VSPRKYRDPEACPGERKWDEYIAALRTQKRAILTNDTVSESGTFHRTGYIALFTIDDIAVTVNGLEFEFKDRIADWE